MVHHSVIRIPVAKCMSPAVALTSKIPSSIVSRETLSLPRSKISTFFWLKLIDPLFNQVAEISSSSNTTRRSRSIYSSERDMESASSLSCRICLHNHTREDHQLIAPYSCKASQEFVHRECLDYWRSVGVTKNIVVIQFKRLYMDNISKHHIISPNLRQSQSGQKRMQSFQQTRSPSSWILKDLNSKRIVDFYVSSAADVYVPTSSNLFSDNVVARRIATGKTQVLVLANRSSLSAENIVTRVKHKLFVVKNFFVHFLIAQAVISIIIYIMFLSTFS
nr:E3 ubiquitin-protein ligase MARCH1 [Ipomoea batatas]